METKEFYLVNLPDKQFLVTVTDEFIESRQLAEKITDKKFEIGNFSFIDCRIIQAVAKCKNRAESMCTVTSSTLFYL